MTNDELITQFGNHVGIRSLKFNEERTLQLLLGKEHVSILNEINSESILLTSVVAQLTPQAAENAALTLLGLNMFFANESGPYVSWEPVNSQLLISTPLYNDVLDEIGLESQIEKMIQHVDFLRDILREQEIVFSNR